MPAPPNPGVVQSVPPEMPKSSPPDWVRLLAPQLSFMRTNWPVRLAVKEPLPAKLPPVSEVTLPLPVETVIHGIGQPGCSTPSGTTPSLVTGNTPPLASA